MYSAKPPLRTYTNVGTPGELFTRDAPAAAFGLKQQLPPTSENCDPNLSFDRDAPRKAESPLNLEERPKITVGNASISPPPGPEAGVKPLGGEAAGECERQQSKEVNRSAKSVPSPTKIPASPHRHGHGHRQHFCRSPRCASNNPDYATPTQTTPRKYLISKRHLLPGAICTRDPAALCNQAQESETPPAPTTRKPPKPFRKLENVFRQPSFSNSSDPKTPSLADDVPPTRIPKPPSTRTPGRHESPSSLDRVPSSTVSPASEAGIVSFPESDEQRTADATVSQATLLEPEAQLFSHAEALEQCNADDESSSDRPVRPVEMIGDTTENLVRVDSDSSSAVLLASCSSRVSEPGAIPEAAVETTQLECPVTESELSTLEKMFLPTFVELPNSRRSDQSFSDLDRSSLAGSTSSIGRASVELEYVTEKLAQNLAFEKIENSSTQAAACESGEGDSGSDDGTGLTEIEEHLGGTSEQGGQVKISESDTGPHFPQRYEEGGVYRFQGELPIGDIAHTFDETKEHVCKSGTGSQCGEEHERGEGHECCAGYACGEGHEGGEGNQLRCEPPVCIAGSTEGTEELQKPRSIASFIANFENAQNLQVPEVHRGVPKYVRGKGRQLWRSDCRDSREVVFLKPTSATEDRRAGDWMVDSILEGAISKLNPSGQGRVRVLVEAFESLMNFEEAALPERRASRVWCLNRMEKGEVDEDGEEFEDGDQRVDCYEVSGDGLQLRASMRLSLGGGNRHAFCNADETSEIEMSAIQKVEDWDDDCRPSPRQPNVESSFEDLNSSCARAQSSSPDGAVNVDRNDLGEDQLEDVELTFRQYQRRMSTGRFSDRHVALSENDRLSDDFNGDGRTIKQFGCYNRDEGKQRIDSLDQGEYKFKASRRRRFWKASSLKSEPDVTWSSSSGSPEKDQRIVGGTLLEPFHLLTEERGAVKEYQLAKKLEQMFAEEERLRNPIAQGLPWTTDEPEVVPKPPVKDQTRPVEFRHYSNSRAIERAEFDNYVAERCAYIEMKRQEGERLRELIEQEEVKRLRREMVPRAQLMPFFDQPFIPTRSSKRLTVPKEPSFHNRQHKRAKCIVWQEQQQQQHHL